MSLNNSNNLTEVKFVVNYYYSANAKVPYACRDINYLIPFNYVTVFRQDH